jgi:hypothetical protein
MRCFDRIRARWMTPERWTPSAEQQGPRPVTRHSGAAKDKDALGLLTSAGFYALRDSMAAQDAEQTRLRAADA